MTYDLTEAHLKALEFIIASGSYMDRYEFHGEEVLLSPSEVSVLPLTMLELNLSNLMAGRTKRSSSYDEFTRGYKIMQDLILEDKFTEAFQATIRLRISLAKYSDLSMGAGDSSLALAIHSILIKWTDSFLGSIESIEEANKRVLMSSLDYRLSN